MKTEFSTQNLKSLDVGAAHMGCTRTITAQWEISSLELVKSVVTYIPKVDSAKSTRSFPIT